MSLAGLTTWASLHLDQLAQQILSQSELQIAYQALENVDKLTLLSQADREIAFDADTCILQCGTPGSKFHLAMQLLVFAARHLKMEEQLLKDHFSDLPNVQHQSSWWSRRSSTSTNAEELRQLIGPLVDQFECHAPSLGGVNTETNRFRRIAKHLQHTILSVSPFVTYPTPFLLKRLESQDSKNCRFILSVSDRTAWHFMNRNNDTIEARLGHQGLSLLYSRRLLPSAQDINSLTQGLVPPCQSRVVGFDYYRSDSSYADLTLSSYLQSLVDRANAPCMKFQNETPCGKPRHEHVFCYAHSYSRITIQMRASSESTSEVPLMWTRCNRCETCTPKVEMSYDCSRYSFAKYIEMLLHNPLFTVHSTHLCRPPLNRLSRNSTLLEMMASHFPSLSSSSQDSVRALGTQGGRPDHRQYIVRCFQLRGFIIEFRYEPVQLYEVALPPRLSQNQESSVTSMISISSSTSAFQQPIDRLKNTLSDFWKTAYTYIADIEKNHLKKAKSRLLPKYSSLFLDRLRDEEKQLALMIKMVEQEYQRQEKQITEKRRRRRIASTSSGQSGVSMSDVHILSSPTISIRTLRKSLWDKMVAIQREIQNWVDTIKEDYPAFGKSVPSFPVWHHPDSYFTRVCQIETDPREPSSFVAAALVSQEVRDLMSVLEEAAEIARLSDDSVSFDSTGSIDMWINQQIALVHKVLTDGRYPTSFENRSPDGLHHTQAKLVDGKHIKYKIIRYMDEDGQISTNQFDPESIDPASRERRRGPSGMSASSSRSRASSVQRGRIVDEVSVTIHYALYFAQLRDLFGIPLEKFATSMSKCTAWHPSGGKSASRFWKTSDGRFVLKQLGIRRKWRLLPRFNKPRATPEPEIPDLDSADLTVNEEEKRMMLSFMPKYLEYMIGRVCGLLNQELTGDEASSSDQPSILVKLFGSFQVKYYHCGDDSGGLEYGDIDEMLGARSQKAVSFDMTLSVMEDLFHGRNIVEKFDLKGIRSRAVDNDKSKKPASNGGMLSLFRLFPSIPDEEDEVNKLRTLWDGNWIKSLYSSSSLFLHPHSKHLLKQAIEFDTSFLQACNIIDYSLLVGVDAEKGELVLGVVDYLCEYNFWKRLENTGKVAFKKMMDVVNPKSQPSPQPTQESFARRLFPLFGSTGPTPRPPTPTKSAVRTISGEGIEELDASERAESDTDSVTIQPPEKYRQRFVKAMDEYFLMVPDKWVEAVSREGENAFKLGSIE